METQQTEAQNPENTLLLHNLNINEQKQMTKGTEQERYNTGNQENKHKKSKTHEAMTHT